MTGIGLVGLAGLIFGIDAHPVVIALFALLLAPAIWDVIRDGRATLAIDTDSVTWKSGARSGMVTIHEIDEAKLATTLDFSQRATLLLKNGQKLRIPSECLPGGRVLDAEMEKRGIRNRRSLFSF